MRAVVQRVSHAAVSVDNQIIGQIGWGLLVLIGVDADDVDADATYIAEKIATLRIFNDENDKMNLSVMDIAGQVLVISQFTLHGDCRRGRRPSFVGAACPDIAVPLYEQVISLLQANPGLKVARGEFGASMQVSLTNEGPVTILLDSRKRF